MIRSWLRSSWAIRAVGWNAGAAVALQGTTFLQAIILTHLLSTHDFGLFSIGNLTLTSLSWLTAAGLGLTVTHFIARTGADDAIGAAAVAGFALRVSLMIASAVGTILIVGHVFLSDHVFRQPEATMAMVAAGFSLPLVTVAIVQTSIMAGRGAFRSIATAAGAQMVAQLALTGGGALASGPNGALAGLVASQALRVVINQRVVGTLLPTLEFRSPLAVVWRRVRSFALPAGLVNLSIAPSLWMPSIAVASTRSATDVGLLATVLLAKTVVTFLPMQFGPVLLSGYGARSANPAIAARFGTRVFVAGIGVAFALGLAMIVAAPWTAALFGRGFGAIVRLMPWLVCAAILESVAQLGSYLIAGQQKMWKSLAFFSTPRDVTIIVLAFVLVPHYGVLGVILAWIAGWSLATLAMTAIVLRSTVSTRTRDPADSRSVRAVL